MHITEHVFKEDAKERVVKTATVVHRKDLKELYDELNRLYKKDILDRRAFASAKGMTLEEVENDLALSLVKSKEFKKKIMEGKYGLTVKEDPNIKSIKRILLSGKFGNKPCPCGSGKVFKRCHLPELMWRRR